MKHIIDPMLSRCVYVNEEALAGLARGGDRAPECKFAVSCKRTHETVRAPPIANGVKTKNLSSEGRCGRGREEVEPGYLIGATAVARL